MTQQSCLESTFQIYGDLDLNPIKHAGDLIIILATQPSGQVLSQPSLDLTPKAKLLVSMFTP